MKNVLFLFLGVCLSLPMLQAQTTVTFDYTGSVQTWTVPSGVTSVDVVAKGSQGGSNNAAGSFGRGGIVTAKLTVTAGNTLNIYVGGIRSDGGSSYNGGGSGNFYGGGATDIRIGGTALTNRVLVAGAGGAGLSHLGGDGGGLIGGDSNNGVAKGGTQSAGGSPRGTLGIGGNAIDNFGFSGGGGGGYYGGGGGSNDAGGGGSSYTNPTLCTNVVHTQGDNTGNGSLSITIPAGAALSFDGTDDYAAIPSNSALNVSQFTIETWLKWDRSTASTDFVCSKGGEQMEIHLNSDNSIRFIPTSRVYLDAPAGSLPLGVWTHVACVYDPSGTGWAKMYINGIEVTLTSNGPNPITTLMSNNTNPFYFGIRSPGGFPFKGQMDEIRIWNRALCVSEIAAHRTCELAANEVGLIAYYKGNQGTANGTNTAITSLTDATTNALNATLTNFAMTGTTSNFVTPGGVTTGTACTPTTFVEINLQSNSTNIADGSTTYATTNNTDFGNVSTASPSAKVYTIQNTGTAALTISSVTSSNTLFAISGAPTTVAAGGTATFTVTFTPTAVGVQTATITVNNDDCTEGVYDFAVQGAGVVSPGAALNFDGVDDYLDAPHNENVAFTGPYTIEAWVKVEDNGGFETIFSKSSNFALYLESKNSSGNFKLTVSNNGSSVSSTNAVPENTWAHVALSYDGTTAKIYVNGILQGSGDMAAPAVDNDGVSIGSWYAVGHLYKGGLDEVRIWNRALCADELLAHKNCELAGNESNLAAYYRFNQGIAAGNNSAITAVTDATTTGYNMAFGNMPLTGATSNFVTPGGVTTGTACTPTTFVEINLQSNATDILDGSTTYATTNNTDFGTVSSVSPSAKVYTIQNTGTGALTISSITSSNTLFAISDAPTSVAAGSSATFTVTFTPTSTGLQTATITVNNDDCTEGVYDFAVQAIGVGCAAAAATLYVDANISASGTGTTWATAYKTFDEALFIAHNCPVVTRINVAKGTYRPTKKPYDNGVEIVTSETRDVTFHVRSGLTVSGGYPNGGGTQNTAANATILSGDIGTVGVYNDNAYHVMIASAGTGTAAVTIDGFTVTDGNANGFRSLLTASGVTYSSEYGGGIYAISGTNTFTNNIIFRNSAHEYGAGINADFGTNTFTNNTLYSNLSYEYGGGISTKSGTNVFSNNVLYSNSAGGFGGGISAESGTNTFTNNVLYSNSAGYGGGIYTTFGTNILNNNVIYRNSVNNNGGGFYNSFGTSTLINCLFWDNKKNSSSSIADADISDNGMGGSSMTVTYCLTQQNSTFSSGTGVINNQDPLFVNAANPAGADGIYRTTDDGLALQAISPAINAGTSTGAPALDILGNAIYGSTKDMGAYESQVSLGAALNFDGADDYAEIPNNNALNVSQVTIETWLKWDRTAAGIDFVCSKGGEQMEIHSNPDNSLRFIPTSRVYLDAPAGSLPLGVWTHVACVYDPSGTGWAKMYINGVEVTLTNNGPNPITTPMINNANPFYFGIRSPGGFPFKGQMDEIRIWNRALCVSEIAAHRTCELAANEVGLIAYYKGNQGTANGTNTAITSLTDATTNALNATLTNFAMTGTTSNFATPGGVTTGTACTPTTFVEINLQSNSTNITDGSTTYATTNNTDFGTVSSVSPSAKVYTIQNTGTGVLNISSIMSSNAQFAVSGAPTSVAAGSSETFTVTFSPTATGVQTATITVNNDDCTEGVYDFAIQGTGVDLCAMAAATLYVDANISVSGAGTTWATAYKTLDEALFVAHKCPIVTRINVAKGTYKPTKNPYDNGVEIVTSDARDVTFHIRAGLTVAGGYPNGGGTQNVAANATILSGDIGTVGDNTDNTYHVMIASAGTGTAAVTIDGFTVTGGNADVFSLLTTSGITYNRNYGGGISTNSGTNTLSNNILYSNSANSGGGIYTESGTNTFTNNILYSNLANNGGGIYTQLGTNRFTNNVLHSNSANYAGGSIYTQNARNTVINNVIYNNTAGNTGGGGFFDAYGTTTFTNCLFWENKQAGSSTLANASIAQDGMGGSTITLTYCLTQLNSPYSSGTGNINNQDPLFVNAANPAGADGIYRTADDGLALQTCSPLINAGTNTGAPTLDIVGNAIFRTTKDIGAYENQSLPNEINVQGNSIDILDGSTTYSTTNNTDFGNVPTTAPSAKVYTIQNTGTGALTISGITSSNAKFVVSGAPTTVAAGSMATFTVTFAPTAAGVQTATIIVNNDDCTEGVYDFAVQGTGIVDLCATAATLYVDANISASGAGTTWATAYKTFDEALFVAHKCPIVTRINVAKGTYKPTKKPYNNGVEVVTSDARDVTFHIRAGLTVAGGYPNGGGTQNVATNATILSGDIGTVGSIADNTYHVMIASAGTGTAAVTIDGFTLIDGNANVFSSLTASGIVYNRNYGGGIYTNSGTNTFTSNTLNSNSADNYGAGIYANLGTNTFINNTIYSNSANIGGGIYMASSTNVLTNNVLYSNSAVNGGGIYTISCTNTFISNVLYSNSANFGGGIYNDDVTSTFTNNVLYSNLASNRSGGIYNSDGTNTFTNCLFWDNKQGGSSSVANADISRDYSISHITVTYCLTQENSRYSSGTGNINNQDPLFVNAANPAGADGIYRTADDGLALQACSPAINAGTNTGAPTLDILGNAIVATTKDMGAYEQQAPSSVEINVQGNATNILKGTTTVSTATHTDFGNVTLNSAVSKTYTIQNTGTGTLSIGSISSTNIKFALSNVPASVPASSSATFTVTFSSATAGVQNGTIAVNNNDCNESVYDFAVQATVSTVLPVELLTFKGTPQYQAVKLDWATATELNTSYFDIERSRDGVTFYKIGTVKAKGSKSTYIFLDENPYNGITYYRLKINDTDGKFTYSNVLSVAANGKTKVKVYPSVTSGILTIESTDTIESVNIFNSIGQLVYTSKPITNTPITINHLPSGVYIVRVATGGEVVSEKIFKQ